MEDVKKWLVEFLDARVIGTNVAGLVKEIVAGKHKLSERLGPGYNVRDLRECRGFWTVEPVIRDMTAAFTGKLSNAALTQAGFDISRLNSAQLVDLLTATDPVEIEATKIAMDELERDLGSIGPDPDEKSRLVAKVYLSQQQAAIIAKGL